MKRPADDDESAQEAAEAQPPKRTATDEAAEASATIKAADAAPATAEQSAPAPTVIASPPQPAAVRATGFSDGPPAVPAAAGLTGNPALVALLTAKPWLADGPASMLSTTQDMVEVAFKLEVPVDAAVAILGYEGLTISTIRERTGCRVRLLEPGYSQTHRAFEVLGAQDGCQMVVGLVLAEMQKSCGTNPTVCTPSPGGAQYTVRVHVRADACGTIIGKGGATINQMRSASGAQIKVRDCHLSDDL